MSVIFLVRHGRSSANAAGVLAGRAGKVMLDDHGRSQAEAAAHRLAPIACAAVVSSPLARTRQTAAIIARTMPNMSVSIERDLNECDYGRWSGKKLSTVAKDPLWARIQSAPSGVTFPGGESMAAMSSRAVAAVRSWSDRLDSRSKQKAWVAVSHGDVIKAVIADALGLHLDLFQRINIEPGSISVVAYSPTGASVLAVNTMEGDLIRYAPAGSRSRVTPTVGGATGA